MTLKEEIHFFMIKKGCLSIGQLYTAFEVEKLIMDYVKEYIHPIMEAQSKTNDLLEKLLIKDNSK